MQDDLTPFLAQVGTVRHALKKAMWGAMHVSYIGREQLVRMVLVPATA
jgi:hypothetical protein